MSSVEHRKVSEAWAWSSVFKKTPTFAGLLVSISLKHENKPRTTRFGARSPSASPWIFGRQPFRLECSFYWTPILKWSGLSIPDVWRTYFALAFDPRSDDTCAALSVRRSALGEAAAP